MSDRGFLIHDQFAVHFLTFSVVEWVDIFQEKYIQIYSLKV
ncbi:hypothetical protein [Daejeonella sp.]|jgi:hypothetical protein